MQYMRIKFQTQYAFVHKIDRRQCGVINCKEFPSMMMMFIWVYSSNTVALLFGEHLFTLFNMYIPIAVSEPNTAQPPQSIFDGRNAKTNELIILPRTYSNRSQTRQNRLRTLYAAYISTLEVILRVCARSKWTLFIPDRNILFRYDQYWHDNNASQKSCCETRLRVLILIQFFIRQTI